MSPLPPIKYVRLDANSATSSPEAEEVSVCTVAATADTGHLLLKLERYSLLKATHSESGSYIESTTFKVGGHTWRIRCYLNGKSKEDAGLVSLFLYLCSEATGPTVHAEFEFALVPHQELGTPPARGHQAGTRTPSTKTSKGVCTFLGKDNYLSWGFKRFISVEELERSMFLEDDCLAVRCTVTVVQVRTVKEKGGKKAMQAHDLARLGMLCKCDDDMCKRHHDRPAVTFLERFANFCDSICSPV